MGPALKAAILLLAVEFASGCATGTPAGVASDGLSEPEEAQDIANIDLWSGDFGQGDVVMDANDHAGGEGSTIGDGFQEGLVDSSSDGDPDNADFSPADNSDGLGMETADSDVLEDGAMDLLDAGPDGKSYPVPSFGFVTYEGDKVDEFLVMRAVGAGWVQAEGANTISEVKAATWSLIEPEPGIYDFSSLAWVNDAAQAGLDVLLTILTGHDDPAMPYHNNYVTCDWSLAPFKKPSVNCVPKDYNHWYRFVYEVVRHFDGTGDAPRVLYFQSMNEAGGTNYFLGSSEDMFGGDKTVVIHRMNGAGDMEVLAAWVPVASLATHDANEEARFIAGACSDGKGYPWAHFIEAFESGATQKELHDLAASYNMALNGAQIIKDILAGTSDAVRQGDFCLKSFRHPETYDAYAIHWYHTTAWYGLIRSLEYLSTRLPPDRPVWITGTGILWLLFTNEETAHRATAVNLVQSIAVARSQHVSWFDLTCLSDYLTCPGLYSTASTNNSPGHVKRYPAADVFRLLTHLFKTLNDGEPEPPVSPTDDTILFRSLVGSVKAAKGDVAIGWCLDEDPIAPGFQNPDCPKEVDVSMLLDPVLWDVWVLYDFEGKIVAHGCGGSEPTLWFAETPFILVRGESSDGDCIPDVVDNCPTVANDDQSDAPATQEVAVGKSNPAIPAPDGVGFACDNCPAHFNPGQDDKDMDGIGDVCE